ncbi:Oleosin 5 [Spatholobus suberectus]|nr:Oleosin 5 [Spatholobus suberectus]
MAELLRSQPQVQVHTATTHRYDGGATPQQRYYEGGAAPQHGGGVVSLVPEISLSGSQVLALLAGVPLGGTLLLLAGVSLIASLAGLAVAAPLFILFSPVLVPAAAALGLAVAGFLAAGACGLVGLVSFSWVVNYLWQLWGTVPEQLGEVKRRVADTAGHVGQKTKEVGQDIQTRAQEAKRTQTII